MNTLKKFAPTRPGMCILASAGVVGYLSALGGCFGGILLFPECNLAPMMFIPLGIIGIAVGLVTGIAWSAFSKREHELRTEFRWLGGFWALTVLLSYKLDCEIVFVSLQVLPLLLGLLIMTNKRLRPNIPAVAYRYRFVYLSAALLVLGTSLFPPVTLNEWMPPERRTVYTESNPMPRILFCTSPRLDASQSYAELNIDRSRLRMEWLAIAAGAGLLTAILFIRNRCKGNTNPSEL